MSQNNIIRYITGLSKNSFITNTRQILRLFSIQDLYFYMKLIFIKNLKNNVICNKIFNYLLSSNYKLNTHSFIKDFHSLCKRIETDPIIIIDNINTIIKDFKNNCLEYDNDIQSELIITCLNNNHDYKMINQLNLVTYAGPVYNYT